MVRAGRDVGGEWYLGRGGGRGAWWCRDGECEGSLSVRALARALHREVLESDLASLRALSTGKST